jgi:HNH endonuclease
MSKKINVSDELLKEVIQHLKIHKSTKEEIKFRKEWEKRTKHVCKPCWELKYCPYGSLVEEFPTLSPTQKEAIEHNSFLKKQLEKDTYKGWRKKVFKKELREFDPKKYPKKHSAKTLERACSIFAHLCPVFFVNEPFTETTKKRRISRYIPRDIMLKVVRRDNYKCQICGINLNDDELEFDHKIPFVKDGPTDEYNLRLACFNCNRSKGTKLPKDILK